MIRNPLSRIPLIERLFSGTLGSLRSEVLKKFSLLCPSLDLILTSVNNRVREAFYAVL
jgi:hypothetical protein